MCLYFNVVINLLIDGKYLMKQQNQMEKIVKYMYATILFRSSFWEMIQEKTERDREKERKNAGTTSSRTQQKRILIIVNWLDRKTKRNTVNT